MTEVTEAEKMLRVVMVDCENANPAKLCTWMLDNKEKIAKVMLINDDNTSSIWKFVKNELAQTEMCVNEIRVERVLTHKSAVDGTLIQKMNEEFYRFNARNFVIASGDSDYFNIMCAMRFLGAHFEVVSETSCMAKTYIKKLSESGIKLIQLDSEPENEAVINASMNEVVQNCLDRTIIHLDVLSCSASDELHYVSEAARKRWCAKTEIVAEVSKNGEITLSLKPQKDP